jgi:hypothetical protein
LEHSNHLPAFFPGEGGKRHFSSEEAYLLDGSLHYLTGVQESLKSRTADKIA